MHCLDLTLPEAAANLALDEALLLEAEAGRGSEVLRMWEWPSPLVVLGSGGVLAEDVDEKACAADGVSILRRSSGGGTVLLGSGCLLYSVVLSYQRDPRLGEIRASYAYIFERLCEVLRYIAPGIACAGTNDLAIAGRKVSGTAQQRKRNFLLHHGSLLYAFDPTKISRYLREPARQPEYRARREHVDFVTNLRCLAAELRRQVRAAFGATEDTWDWPAERTRQLTEQKYSCESWTRRR